MTVISAFVFGPALLITGLVVLALVVLNRDEEPEEAIPTYRTESELTGRVTWSAPAGEPGSRLGWVSGDIFAYADKRTGRFTGRATADGKVRWQYQVPKAVQAEGENSERICSTTPSAYGGVIAVSYQRMRKSGNQSVECSGLLLLDLNTGKPRWDVVRRNLVQPDLVFAGGRLVLEDYLAVGYDLTSPKPRWSKDFGECRMRDLAGDPKVVGAAVECGPNGRVQAWLLDPATGAVRTRTNIGPAPTKPSMALSQVLSANPLVIMHSPIDLKNMHSQSVVSTVSADGRRVQSEFPMPKHRLTDGAEPAVLVTGQRMLIPTDDGKLTSYDLRTGQPVWVRVDLAPDGHATKLTRGAVYLAGTEGRAAYGLVVDRLDERAAVFRANLETGDVAMISPVLDKPPLGRDDLAGVFWDDGRLYVLNNGDKPSEAFSVS